MIKNIIGFGFVLVLAVLLTGCFPEEKKEDQILRTPEERQVENIQPSKPVETQGPVKVDF
ncbi:hypothetical protein KAI58_01695 [Candidatus Gracilibacteria bacterium]|nr:hypothetical protein [Candidatus Gracilibacteria bacterium]